MGTLLFCIFETKFNDMEGKTKNEARETRTKSVRNRSGYKIELLINGVVVVFLPGKITKVPFDADIPQNIGLFVR